jgi:hypothetical protein
MQYKVPTSLGQLGVSSLKGDKAELTEFFARPVLLATLQWSTSTVLSSVQYPWTSFLSNSRVCNRINNFKLLRGNMHIKVMMNGNSFYYGRAMVSWNPLALDDDYYENTVSDSAVTCRMSQRQHIMLDPSQSTGGEMVLPFLWYRDYLSLDNLLLDTGTIGELNIRELYPLKLVTDTTAQPVTITLLMWMSDVEVGALTQAAMPLLVPQSGVEEADEYDGKISKVLKTAARIADPLSSIPVLAPYAKATEMVSCVGANVAKMFGYSKPCSSSDPDKVLVRPIGDMATCIGSDTCMKLTIDPKQEVSVDNRICGTSGEDDMVINKVANIYSLVKIIPWRTTDAVGDLVQTMLVDPGLLVGSSTSEFTCTAVGGMSMPFKYWSGSLEFKFEVIASSYHRGRLAIIYDPVQTVTSHEYNVNYQEVIDISENRSFSVRISNAQDRSILTCFKPRHTTSFPDFGPMGTNNITLAHVLAADNVGNGTLTLRVVNRLTAPTDDIHTEVGIMVSVRACEDFRVYVPDNTLSYLNFIRPQSGIEPIDSRIVHSLDNSVTFDVKGDMSDLSHVYIGEDIYSIRTLLKRYVLYLPVRFGTFDLTSTGTSWLVKFSHPIYPLLPGYARDTIHTDNLAQGINYVGHTFISFYRMAYAAIRGSTRWKYLPYYNAREQLSVIDVPIIVNRDDGAVASGYPNLTGLDTSTPSTYAYDYLFNSPNSNEGLQATVMSVNGTIEFEAPFYTDQRFVCGPSSNECKTSVYVSGYDIFMPRAAAGQLGLMFCAAGEDFNLGHFFGFPKMQYDPTHFPPPTT